MRRTIVSVLLSVAAGSCGIYRPNMVNVPLLEKKGNIRVSAWRSFNGYEGQGALALSNHAAVMANYNNLGMVKRIYSDVNYSIDKHHFLEFGAGYYARNSRARQLEVFLLGGQGVTSHFWQGLDSSKKIATEFRKVMYNRACLQANLGIIHEKWEFALSPRLAMVHYHSFSDDHSTDYKYLPDRYIYADAVFTARFKPASFLMISAQLGGTLPLATSLSPYYDFAPFNAGLGLIMNLNIPGKKDN